MNKRKREKTSALTAEQPSVQSKITNIVELNGSSVLPVSNTRISLETFLWETSEKEREFLKIELCSAILHYLDLDTAVFLENFGILIPEMKTKDVTRVFEKSINIRVEEFRTLTFEKCDDLDSFKHSKVKSIAETKELSQYVHPRLPLFMNMNWTEQDTRRFIRGLLLLLRNETVVSGQSDMLQPIGTFYSHHNRQGYNFKDWFAGADIIFRSTYRQTLKVGSSRVYHRPVLENAWEPLEAAFGKAQKEFEIELEQELQQLGYDTSQLGDFISGEQRKIKVQVFEKPSSEEPGKQILLYCTEGLRRQALLPLRENNSQPKRKGVEFIFQLSTAHQTDAICFDGHIPLWPARPLTIAWILLQGSKTGRVDPGVGLSCNTPLLNSCETALDTILLTSFNLLSGTLLSPEGPFNYINVVGITAEEAAVAKKHSFKYLATLLQHKGLDQATKVTRTSVVAKTKLEHARIKWKIPPHGNIVWKDTSNLSAGHYV